MQLGNQYGQAALLSIQIFAVGRAVVLQYTRRKPNGLNFKPRPFSATEIVTVYKSFN